MYIWVQIKNTPSLYDVVGLSPRLFGKNQPLSDAYLDGNYCIPLSQGWFSENCALKFSRWHQFSLKTAKCHHWLHQFIGSQIEDPIESFGRH